MRTLEGLVEPATKLPGFLKLLAGAGAGELQPRISVSIVRLRDW